LEHQKISGRQLKREIFDLLQRNDAETTVAEIVRYPARMVVNPLFLGLCSIDQTVKWQAVTAMGLVVSRLGEQDMESARVIMRRFMWNLNEESGGIGWGCPEAMGETMARNSTLADEYWCILLSYIQPGGNFLEHEALQQGVLWALGRLARARPELLQNAPESLRPFLQAEDAALRGLAVWSVCPLAQKNMRTLLKKLINDTSVLMLYRNGRLMQCLVSELANEALQAILEWPC
jgi:hypothetical protein